MLGHVMRPGPRVLLAPKIIDSVIEGLRGPFRLRIVYGAPDAQPRTIEPHGLLLGPRSYLVTLQPDRGKDFLNFRLDRIVEADRLDESFAFQRNFSLDDYVAWAFGAYRDASQFGEFVWRFTPKAAARAAEFRFHPSRTLEYEDDGSLIVQSHAAGWLEMAWFLYQWGDAVEVLAPRELRNMTVGYRRSDFEALPLICPQRIGPF